jgi:hypothetical protein
MKSHGFARLAVVEWVADLQYKGKDIRVIDLQRRAMNNLYISGVWTPSVIPGGWDGILGTLFSFVVTHPINLLPRAANHS